MSCTKLESDIALYAGGDLPVGRVARTAQHLADCADCRALVEELRAEQALLSELRDEPLEDEMVARVRRGVVEELWGRPVACGGLSGRLWWKLALAATLVLATVLLWPRHRPVEAPRTIAAHQSAPTLAGLEPAAGHGPAPHARRRRHHPARPTEPLLVQFVTNDPNIVIYWLVDQKPQGD